jgi:hypothetical protein
MPESTDRRGLSRRGVDLDGTAVQSLTGTWVG